MSRTTCTDQDIATMLLEGKSSKAIRKAHIVGQGRITRIRASLGEGVPAAEVDDDSAEVEADDPPETVTVDAGYLRALEAVVYLVEQNQRLHLAVANG